MHNSEQKWDVTKSADLDTLLPILVTGDLMHINNITHFETLLELFIKLKISLCVTHFVQTMHQMSLNSHSTLQEFYKLHHHH